MEFKPHWTIIGWPSARGSHLVGFGKGRCMQPYPHKQWGCLQDLNPWPLDPKASNLIIAPWLTLSRVWDNKILYINTHSKWPNIHSLKSLSCYLFRWMFLCDFIYLTCLFMQWPFGLEVWLVDNAYAHFTFILKFNFFGKNVRDEDWTIGPLFWRLSCHAKQQLS